jgi:hypothetical protein
MSIDYTGDPTTYHDIVQLPADGDNNDASNITAPFEACLDNIEYLKQLKHVQSSVQRQMRHAEYSSSQVTRSIVDGSVSGWQVNHPGPGDATVENIVFPIEVPQGATITQIRVTIDPANGHGGLPASMPRWELLTETATGVATLADSQTDTSANAAAFDANHTIQKTISVGPVNNATTRYTLKFFSEAGANSLTGLRVTSVLVTFNMTILDEGAA